MSWAEARRDQPGGKLEAGLDADFDREVVRVFELIVSDDRHEGAEHFESAIEIQPRFHGVGKPCLGVPTELKGTSAIITLNIKWSRVVIIYIQLLPDSPYTASYKRP